MKFEEIFNEQGLYVGEDFAEGYCFEVTKTDTLCSVSYKSKDDILPIRENPIISKQLLKQDFKRVFTRQSLFK
jgi:hypothetical protein